APDTDRDAPDADDETDAVRGADGESGMPPHDSGGGGAERSPESSSAAESDASEPHESASDPPITTDLPELPPPPTVAPGPYVAVPGQIERLREYYGPRSGRAVPIEVTVDSLIDAPEHAVRYVRRGLTHAGLVPGDAADSPRATAAPGHPGSTPGPAAGSPSVAERRSVLDVSISGEQMSSREHFYARGHVVLTYRTGPGRRLSASTTLRGPYRLSQVSITDAVLRSVRAITPEIYAAALSDIDDLWITSVERSGLPYQLEWPDAGDECSTEPRFEVPLFDVPPLLWYRLMLLSRNSDCHYSLDPLTGIIRIVYNGTT
ncbi:MAG: hypothetical protein ACOCYB_11895, partial [Alkalispirochaeta sp.]